MLLKRNHFWADLRATSGRTDDPGAMEEPDLDLEGTAYKQRRLTPAVKMSTLITNILAKIADKEIVSYL